MSTNEAVATSARPRDHIIISTAVKIPQWSSSPSAECVLYYFGGFLAAHQNIRTSDKFPRLTSDSGWVFLMNVCGGLLGAVISAAKQN